MKIFTIPDDLLLNKIEEINFIDYYNNKTSEKNKVFFKQNVISFVIRGEKDIYHEKAPVKIKNAVAVIKASNCLMTERISSDGKNYRALLLFFDNSKLLKFSIKYYELIEKTCSSNISNEICIFPNDAYILSFCNLILNMLQSGNNLSEEFKEIKLQEFFLYLLQNYPDKFCQIIQQKVDEPEIRFKTVIENNIFSNLSNEELAFLTNMSISTFKRHFKKYYKMSPHQWFITKKMEYAHMLIKQDHKPSELFKKIGYSTLSNFLKAYKKYLSNSSPIK